MTTKKTNLTKENNSCNACKCGCGKIAFALIVAGLVGGVIAAGAGCLFCHPKKTVIVNFDKVQQEATAYKAILDAQRKYEEQLQAQLSLDFGVLQKEDQELIAQKDKMKEADYKKKVDALQKKAVELQQSYRLRTQQIMGATQLAAKQIQGDIEKALERVAQKAHAGVILNAPVVVYADDKTNNITDLLIKELNESVKPVAYPNPDQVQISVRQNGATQGE